MKFVVLLFTFLGTCTVYGSQTNVNHAMQDTKMDFECPHTENIKIILYHDLNSNGSKVDGVTLNLNIPTRDSDNLTKNEEVKKMVSGYLNRKAENLNIRQLNDVKQYFRTPKPTTAQKVITLFAYEIPTNAQI